MTGQIPEADPFTIAARVFALAAVASLAFFIGGGWVSDDIVHILNLRSNSAWQALTGADGFGFYRPAAQLSLWLESRAHGMEPALFRVVNVALHTGVWLLAYRVAREMMTPRAAGLAALAFILAPKAPTMAVLWISARPELLVSLFSLAAAFAWLRWHTRGGWWIGLAAGSYLLALLAKESAALLPLALLAMTPQGSQPSLNKPRRDSVVMVAVMLALAIVPLWLRWRAGALMPWSLDEHYTLDWSPYRLMRGLEIYVPRALPSPVALLIVVGVPAAFASGGIASLRQGFGGLGRMALIAVSWFAALMLPVLPIPARSELYLYLPGFGFCLFAGYVVDRLLTMVKRPRAMIVALVVYAVALLSYQGSRHAHAHEVQQFTRSLAQALDANPWFRTHTGLVSLVAADANSEELMRDGVGGYISGLLALVLPGHALSTTVIYSGEPHATDGSHIVSYAFGDGMVTLRPD
jgi:hypothetical protein